MSLTDTSIAPEIGPMKDIQRLIWSQGDYAPIAREMEPAAQALVDALEIEAAQSFLDVAAGNGNLAAAAARAGCAVHACDLTPKMVSLGEARCEAEGLAVEWLEADAEELPFEDGSFDRVGSVFGAMFAPRPHLAATEMFRVLAPGGRLGMVNWIPEGFIGRLVATVASHLPAAAGTPPTDWGDERTARDRLSQHAADIVARSGSIRFVYDSTDALICHYERCNGPIIAARMLLRERYPELVRDLSALINEFNAASDGSVVIEAEYLLVTAVASGDRSSLHA
jgi:SAM-dependent methyltransferase